MPICLKNALFFAEALQNSKHNYIHSMNEVFLDELREVNYTYFITEDENIRFVFVFISLVLNCSTYASPTYKFG